MWLDRRKYRPKMTKNRKNVSRHFWEKQQLGKLLKKVRNVHKFTRSLQTFAIFQTSKLSVHSGWFFLPQMWKTDLSKKIPKNAQIFGLLFKQVKKCTK